MKICLFGPTYKDGDEANSIQLLMDAGKKMGIEIVNLPKSKLIGRLGEDNIFKFESLDPTIRLEELDAVYLRMIVNALDGNTKEKVRIFPEMVYFAKYLHSRLGKTVFDSFLIGENTTFSKTTNTIKLSEAGIPNIPTTFLLKKSEVLKKLEEFDYPLLIKPVDGARGQGVMKFESGEEFKKFLKEDPHVLFFPNLIQKWIPNDGDYRIVVLGDQVVAAVKKSRIEGNVTANMSQGNEAIPVQIDKELEEIAVKAAKAVGIEFAGVDIIEDKITGKRYVLEVNLSPQITLTSKFSQVDIATKVLEYIANKL